MSLTVYEFENIVNKLKNKNSKRTLTWLSSVDIALTNCTIVVTCVSNGEDASMYKHDTLA